MPIAVGIRGRVPVALRQSAVAFPFHAGGICDTRERGANRKRGVF